MTYIYINLNLQVWIPGYEKEILQEAEAYHIGSLLIGTTQYPLYVFYPTYNSPIKKRYPTNQGTPLILNIPTTPPQTPQKEPINNHTSNTLHESHTPV